MSEIYPYASMITSSSTGSKYVRENLPSALVLVVIPWLANVMVAPSIACCSTEISRPTNRVCALAPTKVAMVSNTAKNVLRIIMLFVY